jgi:alpha-galactosidase/6-phospho-beta-glucosidase family protein
MSKPLDIRIAYIGGGSRAWAVKLMKDLALTPGLTGALALYDIDPPGARHNARLADRVFSHPEAKSRFRTCATRTAAEALTGADFVVMSIEPGPIRMRYADLEIPARYGILQTVGDSVGPGGLVRALRCIGVYEEYAHLIRKHCPKAWVFNYTNPMTLCTAALYAAEPGIRAFGCCHEVFGTQHWLGGMVANWYGVPRPARHEIDLDITGLNHFTFATAATWKGRDLFPRLRTHIGERGFFKDRTADALQRRREGKWFSCDSLIACDFMRRFGVLGAAGDRHLAEFVPWYLASDKALHRWGVIRTPYSYRVKRQKNRATFKPGDALTGSNEEGVIQMTALLGLTPLITNVNMPNRGQSPDLPEGWIVESKVAFTRDSIQPIVSRPLPAAVAALQQRAATMQKLTLEAGLTRNRELALQALLLDPLAGRLSTDQAAAMLGEMLRHVKSCLPGWKL